MTDCRNEKWRDQVQKDHLGKDILGIEEDKELFDISIFDRQNNQDLE